MSIVFAFSCLRAHLEVSFGPALIAVMISIAVHAWFYTIQLAVCLASRLDKGFLSRDLHAKLRLTLLGIAVARIINNTSKSQEHWVIGQ